ncbi:MAG: DNA internalization-related competence protein ComEC/Rec2, partial [Bacilli bacterium]|nr:DNA internalization-related competence protein ComEC/Rec2 [Bacilli bacterium]
MKKLRITLLFSVLIFIYVFYITNNNIYKTKYKITDNRIEGYINNVKVLDSKIEIELIGKEKVLVNYYDTNLDLKLGDYVLIEGTFKIPSVNTNFNLFNYNKYLKSKKIYYIFKASKITKIKNNNKLKYKIKNKIIDRIDKIDNDYLYTFILGDNSYIKDDVKHSYRNNGISHLFSISGMHITFLSSFLLIILNKLFKNKYIINIIIFSLLIFYMFLTNFTPSVIRATFLFIMLSINKLFNLKLNPLISIIIILDLMLLKNPYYIYNMGFVLSFLVSISLIIFGKITNNYKNYFVKIFMISLISFLISIPIMINNNNEINLLSPLINIIFVPLISIIIFPLSLLTFVFKVLNPILKMFIDIEENIIMFFNNINIFTIILKEINIFFIIFYYILIIFVIKKLINKKYKFLLLIFALLLFHNNINYLNKNFNITMIDVGQGDSILIELPNNKCNILIDTGGIVSYDNKNTYSLASNTIIPYLKSIGVKKIDYLILTHGDYDHMGEAINLVNNFKVEKVIFNCGEYNDLEKELIKVLDKKKIKYYSCIKELNIDKNKLYFLNNKDYGNENDNSSIIYTKLNNHKFLFMGDAGIEVEEDLIKKYNLQDIDVLKVGHHG